MQILLQWKRNNHGNRELLLSFDCFIQEQWRPKFMEKIVDQICKKAGRC